MIESKLAEIREQLLRGGVAPKYVQRAIFEFRTHFDDLMQSEIQSGSSADEAEQAAHDRFGNTDNLVANFIDRPELYSLSHRYPILIHCRSWTLMLSCWFVLSAATSFALAAYSGQNSFPRPRWQSEDCCRQQIDHQQR